MKPVYVTIGLFLYVLLGGCSTAPVSTKEHWETCLEVSVTDIQVELTGQTSRDGQPWFTGKATATNNSPKAMMIEIVLQGVDAAGFEQEDLWLGCRLMPGETKIVTGRDFTPEANFRKIVKWQLRKVRYLVE